MRTLRTMVRLTVILLAAMALITGTATGGITIETVPVGNPGNAPDAEVMNDGTTGYGGVAYTYNVGKYEVSNAQYTAFLNAVAADDTYALYDTYMWYADDGCKIERSGTVGSYTYSVAADRANRPVSSVSFWDACRFANWLHNGQPAGAQDLTTTEDGAYFLDGEMWPLNTDVNRKADWKWAVTSEDEWYKAAYYDGVASVYYDYPTGSNTAPTVEPPPGADMINGSANCSVSVAPTYYSTECGAYTAKPSDSPHGTFDQGGNVWEWNEAILGPSGGERGVRGGSWDGHTGNLRALARGHVLTMESSNVGFRVSEVSAEAQPIPEPGSLVLLGLGLTGALVRRKGPRR